MLIFRASDWDENPNQQWVIDARTVYHVNVSIPWVTNRARDAVKVLSSNFSAVGPDSIIHIIDTVDRDTLEDNMRVALDNSMRSENEYFNRTGNSRADRLQQMVR